MQNWFPRWIKSLLLMLTLSVFAVILTGCAGHMKVVCEKPAPLPVTLSRQQLPDAKNFSEKASDLSKKVAAYFLETPQFTTPQ